MNITHDITTEQIHRITDVLEPMKRYADVHFVNGKFTKCTYRVSAPNYTLEDWEFINMLSHKILLLATR